MVDDDYKPGQPNLTIVLILFGAFIGFLASVVFALVFAFTFL